MRTRPRAGRRCVVAALIGFALVSLAATPAIAQTKVRIREAVPMPDGKVRLSVSVGGDAAERTLAAGDFAVFEAGKKIQDIEVEPLVATAPAAIALAIDVSGSTAGKPIVDAKAAAKAFVDRLADGTRVTIIAFSDTAWVRTGLTDDRDAIRSGLDRLTAGGGTAVYDGIALAAWALRGEPGQRTIVVFSDGKDTASTATLAEAIDAAKSVRAPLTAVALATKDSDREALSALAAGTRGSLVEVGASAGLASAFSGVASELTNQYLVRYTGSGGGTQLEIAVALGAARDAVLVANPRKAAAAPKPEPRPVAPAAPPVAALAGQSGLIIGLAAAFLFVALFGLLLGRRAAPTQGLQSLRRGIDAFERRNRVREDVRSDDEPAGARAEIGRAADDLLNRVPRLQRFERRLQQQLERAAWPVRASEFLMLQTGSGLASLILVWALIGRWPAGVAAGLVATMVPRALMNRRVAKRQAMFLEQLPDTLTLLAGTLKAGYGFAQAVDVLVRETPQPTAGEFTRVLTEARLGMPIEGAMTAMAERTGSEDFRWVVLAINIQRQVGGNLADLLTTVAGTLREREQVRRQIKTLSAEGRLSAIILGALPFVIAGYVQMVNPTYLSGLFTSSTGKMMIGAALGLMGLGLAWIRKIIRIDV